MKIYMSQYEKNISIYIIKDAASSEYLTKKDDLYSRRTINILFIQT